MAHLKAARERAGVTLEQIAQSTKVSAALLAALERGDLRRWPKGIFRRSFFRDYVAAIGLAPDAQISLFVTFFPEDASATAAPGACSTPRMRAFDQAFGWLRRLRGAASLPATRLSANP